MIKRLLYKIRNAEMYYRFKKSEFKFKKEDFEQLSKLSNISINKLILDYIISTYRYGCVLNDYIVLEIFKLNSRERKKFVYTRQNGKLHTKLNAKSTAGEKLIFIDKNEFNKTYKKYIKRKSIKCDSITEVIEFINQHDKFIIKPLDLCGGKGIDIVYTNNIKNIKEFVEKLCNENYILEECLEQHEKMKRLNPTSINTIRPLCIRSNDGTIKLVACALRVGKEGATIDNLSAGGVIYPIDIETGKVTRYGLDRFGNIFLKHPGTNIFMPGFEVPNWNMIVNTIKEAMDVIPNIRLVGWDICVKENDIEFIEGNIYPGPNTFQIDGIPKLDIIKKLI